MRTAISAFEQRSVAVSLAYSEKYHGIIGEALGFPELVMAAREAAWNDMEERVADAVCRVLERRGEYIRRISELIPSIQKHAIQSIASLQVHIS